MGLLDKVLGAMQYSDDGDYDDYDDDEYYEESSNNRRGGKRGMKSQTLDDDYEEEEYQLYTEALNRTPEEWMAEAVYMAKKDPHFTKEMKKYLNSSIYSAIKVPRRNNINNR